MALKTLGFSERDVADIQALARFSNIDLDESLGVKEVVARTQTAWFRKTFASETSGNSSMLLDRWTSTSAKVEDLPDVKEPFQRLGIVDAMDVLPAFSPYVVILLGCIEPQVKHRLDAVPHGYSGEIVVHSNQRGLVHFLEPMCYDFISERTGVDVDVIKGKIADQKAPYDLALPTLQDSTRHLRELISDKEFAWPDYKDLYTRLYSELLKMRPDLHSSKLVFDDPPVLNGDRIYTTFTEAKYWCTKYLSDVNNVARRKLLALSSQPFVLYQDTVLKAAIGEHFEICTVGPSHDGILVKDCFESLAKIIYERAKPFISRG